MSRHKNPTLRSSSRHKSQRGSVLWILLISIALFAALSYVVGDMLRGGNAQSVGDEKAKLYASEILQYGRVLRGAIQDMRISNGCEDEDISLDNSIVSGYTNGSNTSCQLFNSAGGDVTYLEPSSDLLDSTAAAQTLYGEHYFTADITGEDIGGSDNDLVYFLPFIKKEICIQINEKLNIDNPSNDPPAETDSAWSAANTKFTGDFSASATPLQQAGATAGCFEGSASNTPPSGTYSYFQVLIAR